MLLMTYCPDWIFDAVCAQVANEYLAQELPINNIAKKYSDGLSEKYSVIPAEEFAATAEEMIRSLDEIKVESEAVPLLTNFTYFRLVYESANIKRKMKPMFGSVDAPTSTKTYSLELAIKRFKAYLFSVRSSVAVEAERGWKLSNFEQLPLLKDVASKSINILDIL